MFTRLPIAAATLATLLLPTLAAGPALAQSAGYFIPPQPAAPHASAPARTPRTARPVPVAAAPLPPDQEAGADDQAQQQQQPLPPLPQPPVPVLPALPKVAPPPTVIVGVLGVPDVMRQSNAAQIIQRIIGARKEKLRVDFERSRANWRAMEASLQADAPKLTPDQGRTRERSLRERVSNDQRGLQDRNRIIAEAGQVALNQIESTLVAVIRQVAESHGMNVVLHRSQVALNTPEFDITDQVVAQLNKLMPTVQIPEEGIDPAKLPKDWGTPPGVTAATTSAAQPTH